MQKTNERWMRILKDKKFKRPYEQEPQRLQINCTRKSWRFRDKAVAIPTGRRCGERGVCEIKKKEFKSRVLKNVGYCKDRWF